MQANMAWVLDLFCVWVLVVAALIVFCFHCGCQQERLCCPTQMQAIFLAKQQPTRNIGAGLARCQKFMGKVPPMICCQ